MIRFSHLALAAITLASPIVAAEPEAPKNPQPVEKSANGVPAPYTVKDYSHLLGMPGFSDYALKTHFKLYGGYVKNSNLLLSILNQYMQEGQDRTPQYADIKRRLGWEMDGMRLHEFYFGNLGGDGKPNEKSALYQAIVDQYGSYDNWKKDFEATGMMRGIGWSILYRDPTDGRLINMWINEHDHGHLADGDVILPMDVFEHAYMLDYGLNRQGYIDAYFENIDWNVVQDRYDRAVKSRQ